MTRAASIWAGWSGAGWTEAVIIAAAVIATVAALPAQAQEMTARGVVAPRVEATLSAQISGRLLRLPADRGQKVKIGDVLAEFDCALEQARAKAAKAELDGATARLINLQRLDRMGSVGKVEVQIAAADMERAAALLEERNAVLRYCVVIAPFSGVVVDVPAHAYESVEAGKPLVSLLDDKSLRIVALAPSNWIGRLKPGMALTFKVDETGESVEATVSHIDGRIDPGGQIITVFADPRLQDLALPLIAGMTGAATFKHALSLTQ
jgi:RND family efflux transporter MFP subunit